MLPEPAVAAVAVARSTRGFRLALDLDTDGALRGGVHLARPELALRELALAAAPVLGGVDVELTKISMSDQQPRQVVPDPKGLVPGARERPRQGRLRCGGYGKAVLDIVLLA